MTSTDIQQKQTDVATWDPFDELDQLQRHLARVFPTWPRLIDWHRAAGTEFTPLADFKEAHDAYVIEMELPGIKKEDIKVEATEESAVITAEREDKRYRAEVGLRSPVRPESGKAEYRNGMLEISFSLKDKTNKGFRRVNVV